VQISFLGHSCFRLKGRDVRILIDPFVSTKDVRLKKQETDVLLISHEHDDHNDRSVIKDPKTTKIFAGPGEYEVKGAHIRGIATFHDTSRGSERGWNTVYIIEIDGITICHLGDLGEELDDDLVEDIGEVDIVLVPVGGTYTINAGQAAEIIRELDPRIVIPMHARESGFDYTEKFDTLDDYIKADGSEVGKMDILKINAGDFATEGRKIVILERS